jgi:hypothetical protein
LRSELIALIDIINDKIVLSEQTISENEESEDTPNDPQFDTDSDKESEVSIILEEVSLE